MKKEKVISDEDPIHDFFGLDYTNYLVLPRSVLQSMPLPWQRKFVKLMDEAWDMGVEYPREGTNYQVDLVFTGKLYRKQPIKAVDPLADYERGRRRIKFPMGDG